MRCLAGGWSDRLYITQCGRIVKVQISFFLCEPSTQAEQEDDHGVAGQSKQSAALLYTVVVLIPRQTQVFISCNSKGEFIDYKEPIV